MKNLIANFLMVVTLISGSVIFASAQKPQRMANGKAVKTTETIDSAANFFTVSAYTSRSHTYSMSKGDSVEIVLDGDGDTDLDLYVYDSAGRLIDSSAGSSDYEVLEITAYANTTMTVKVINRGSLYNQYDLTVWNL